MANIVQKSTSSLSTALKYNELQCFTSTSIPAQKEIISGSCNAYGNAKLTLSPGPLSSITPANVGTLQCVSPTGAITSIAIPSSLQVVGTSLIGGYSLSGISTLTDGRKFNVIIKIRPRYIEG